ncbi:hypothetical protein BC937DRAFT_87464, partial [Endogone sp. FLAS-F59071]
MQVTPPKRRNFAAGAEAYPGFNFYIESNILEKFGEYLHRQFCLLIGHRQSGKTTICQALLRWFDEHPEKFTEFSGGNRDDFDIFVATFDGSITVDQGPKVFWESICRNIRSLDPERFTINDTVMDSATFKIFFSKRAHPSSKPVILIIDEASRLTSVGGTITEVAKEATDQFISTLRALKNPHDFLLHSVALVSTAIEVKELFDEFAKDGGKRVFESADISADIFELTLGHKGLVGSCGAFIQQTYELQPSPIRMADEWKKATTHELREYILNKQHYDSIKRSLNLLPPESKSILIG